MDVKIEPVYVPVAKVKYGGFIENHIKGAFSYNARVRIGVFKPGIVRDDNRSTDMNVETVSR